MRGMILWSLIPFLLSLVKKIIPEILKEAHIAQYILKGLVEIQLFIFKHLLIETNLSFHLFLLCIPSVSKMTQHTEWKKNKAFKSYLELYQGNLFSRKYILMPSSVQSPMAQTKACVSSLSRWNERAHVLIPLSGIPWRRGQVTLMNFSWT